MKDLTRGIDYSPTSRIIWEHLLKRFSKVDVSRIFNFHREIFHVKQGTLSVAQYFGRLKGFWDEFAVVDDDWLCCDCSIRRVRLLGRTNSY